MGKRSSFERRERDFYPTPAEAVAPLLRHLPPHTRFVEPCAGDGALLDVLQAAGHMCVEAYDIEPRTSAIMERDALSYRPNWPGDCFITNSPWTRAILHPLLEHLSDQAPTWLLLDADWKHTRQAAPYMQRLRRIVSVGRVKWIPGSKHTGKDNCAWHLFDKPAEVPALFFGRAA